MLKALIKKQTLEMLSFLFKSGKAGKMRSKGSVALYSLLMIYVVGVMGWMFWMVAATLCGPFVQLSLDWLYFCIMALTATVMGVFFSVFSTQSQLYEAKDNELLLSMPIPSRMLLLSRMLTLYLQTFFFEVLVMVPALIVYYPFGGISVSGILMLFILPFVALALSCVLGWVVALIVSRMKNKSLFSVVLSVLFLAAYFVVYSRINSYLNLLLANIEQIGENFAAVFPLKQLGLAFSGDAVSMLIFLLFTAVLFCAVYAVLSLSFIKIVTAKRAASKRRYVKRELKVGNISGALLKKEFLRYRSLPAYIMNCSLGSVFMLAGAVYVFIKGSQLREMLIQIPGWELYLPIIGCAAVCLTSTMNDITAPSVSLEGRTLWLSKALPVSAIQVLSAKVKLHLYITLPFALLFSAAVVIAAKADITASVLMLTVPLVFVLFTALFGIVLNLKFPNFTWINETVAVKQSASVSIALFGSWGVIFLFGGLFYLLHASVPVSAFLALTLAVLSLTCALLWQWIVKRGTRIFNSL